jgi:acetyl-CoA carboxylase biotin carboxyl carrier protein
MNDKKPKSPLDPEVVRELAALLEETGLSEIEIERDGMRVRVAKAVAMMAPMMAPMAAQGAAPAVSTAPAAEPVRKKGTVVTSPMVGTIYLSPQPGADPFVKVGDSVKDGTLCIVEAMKTMNPVPAPVAGRIVEIYVLDGQPVEFGEPLMLID